MRWPIIFDNFMEYSTFLRCLLQSLLFGSSCKDMVIESIGQGMDLSYLSKDIKSKIEFGPRGRILVNEDWQAKGLPRLFIGGDIIEGPDVIHGIANGHRGAMSIDSFLNEGR